MGRDDKTSSARCVLSGSKRCSTLCVVPTSGWLHNGTALLAQYHVFHPSVPILCLRNGYCFGQMFHVSPRDVGTAERFGLRQVYRSAYTRCRVANPVSD